MKFHLVTLFPSLFDSFLEGGILGRALNDGRLEVGFRNPRDFAEDKHRSVDDAPYGGGSGMVMMPGPLMSAVESLDDDAGARVHRILLTPQGRPFRQADAKRLSGLDAIALICGRYEGVDERARSQMDEEISLGDFVLFGGEVAAMAVIEAVGRLLPGVLGNHESLSEESHGAGLLEYPHYTRPAEFRGEGVPSVLTSGNHAAIATWRREQALKRTATRRPDLLAEAELSAAERAAVATTQGGAAE